MADDDMNGNGAERHYQDALQAQLGERVTNLGRRQTDLEAEMRSGFRQVEAAMQGLANETRSSIAALTTSIAERNKPQWQALGVALTFCTILGGLAYWPINAATTDLKGSVAIITEKMVSQQEMEWRSARGAEDRLRQEASLNDLRAAASPRAELDRIPYMTGLRSALRRSPASDRRGEAGAGKCFFQERHHIGPEGAGDFCSAPWRELRHGNAIAPPLREDAELWCKWNRSHSRAPLSAGFSSSAFGVAPLEIFVRGTTQTSPEQTASPL